MDPIRAGVFRLRSRAHWCGGPDSNPHGVFSQGISVGTQAQTSVLHTAGAAALRGFSVVVPVDGVSSDDVFPEFYTAWHLSTASRIADKTTLTKTDMVEF